METVAIFGTGLIGASFGLALKAAGFRGRVLGVSSPGAVREALERTAIDAAATTDEVVRSADLVYLAQPIRRIIETLTTAGPRFPEGCLITDAGSTKVAIAAAAREHVRRARFVGGHPLAGKEKRGAREADPDLFRGRTYVLTGDPPAELLHWIKAIGAVPVIMTPEEHDRVVAATSHLPQLISTALAAEAATADLRISGPGLADMLRLSGSAWEIWEDILRTNTGPIAAALDCFIARLERMRASLPDLAEDFERAKSIRPVTGHRCTQMDTDTDVC